MEFKDNRTGIVIQSWQRFLHEKFMVINEPHSLGNAFLIRGGFILSAGIRAKSRQHTQSFKNTGFVVGLPRYSLDHCFRLRFF
jgi:hypothetical protein